MSDQRFANLAITLSFEFQKYLMQHPELADRIPEGAVVVLQLEGNPEFNLWSRNLADSEKRAGRKVVTVRLGPMTPPVSRIAKAELQAS